MRPYTMHQVIVLLCVLAAADAGAHCDISLIKGVDTNKDITFEVPAPPDSKDLTAKYLQCTNPTKDIVVDSIYYPILKCDQGPKWKNQKTNQFLKPPKFADKDIVIACKTKACHESLILGFSSSSMSYEFKTGTYTLKCKKEYEHVKYIGSNDPSASLECKPGAKWTAGGKAVGYTDDAATDLLTVTGCEINPCHEALITKTNEVISSTSTPLELSCPTPQLLKIDAGEPSFAKLTCNPLGWTDGVAQSLRGAQEMISVSCGNPPIKYCGIIQVGSVAPGTTELNGILTVSCTTAGASYGLFYGEAPNDKQVTGNAKLTCTKDGGWLVDATPVRPDAGTPMKIECREACINIEDGWKTDAEFTVQGEYACKTKFFDNEKNTIKLNGVHTYSNSLKCDINKGWTDVIGKTIEADAFKKVKIECEDSKCGRHLTPGSCKVNDEENPEGYFCEGLTTKRSPLKASNDPNFLGCDKEAKNKIIYDFANKKFYDYTLRCKNDGTWYKSDDSDQITKVDEKNIGELLCLQKRCTKCEIKLKGTGVFTQPTTHDCAKVECTNDVWKIKREGSSEEEEYAGKVLCDAEKDGNNLDYKQKWVIDDNIKISEGTCISGTDVSCKIASKLETKCDLTWTSFGCKELTPDDNQKIECDTGKKMFYKPRGSYGFVDGGDSFECDKPTGKWKVTTSGQPIDPIQFYERGATVICADSNPAPTTTTQLPTTTPPPNACEMCLSDTSKPNGLKEADITKEDSGEICTIARIDKGKFHTDVEETDKLMCNKTDVGWKTDKGNLVARIEGGAPKEEEQESQMMYIVGGAVFGVIVLLIVFAVIFKVCISGRKKRDDKDEETKRKMLEDEKKKKKKAGDNNDEILDEQSVDAPSELKL